MPVTLTPITTLFERTYDTMLYNILRAANLDPEILDAVSLELACDLEWYPFGHAKHPQSRQPFENDYDAFHAMMRDAFGHAEWQRNCDAVQRNLQHHQYYLAWAWTENERAHNCLCRNPSYHDPQRSIQRGLIHSHNAQRAYLHALAIMLL